MFKQWMNILLGCVNENPRYFDLTVEYPNVTLCYKVELTFLNPKLNQIRRKLRIFGPYSYYKILNVLGIVQLTYNKLIIFITSRLPVDNRLFSFAFMLSIASLYIASRNACKYCTTFYCRHSSQFS